MAFGITDLKKGVIFKQEGTPYVVLDYNQKVVGRGGSIVNVRIKSLFDGKVLSKTFKGNESIEPAEIINKNVQYLYNDGTTYFFMDSDTFEQFEIAAEIIGDGSGYLKEGDIVIAKIFEGNVITVELAKNVWLTITYTEDVTRGDTSGNLQKDATLETGLIVKVPAFIKQGDTISVSTETGEYRERQK